MRTNGFTVELRTLHMRGGQQVEKGVDVALVTKMLALGFKKAYDVAIIVSGDNDLVGAIHEVKDLGIRVEVACFNCGAGKGIKEAADKVIRLDDIAPQVRLKK